MRKFKITAVASLVVGLLSSCSNYEQRKAGVKKVCPNCTYTYSERRHIAVDTSVQPNIVYLVDFCAIKRNGILPVDYLIRLN